MGHFGDILTNQCLGLVLKRLDPIQHKHVGAPYCQTTMYDGRVTPGECANGTYRQTDHNATLSDRCGQHKKQARQE